MLGRLSPRLLVLCLGWFRGTFCRVCGVLASLSAHNMFGVWMISQLDAPLLLVHEFGCGLFVVRVQAPKSRSDVGGCFLCKPGRNMTLNIK